MKQINATLVAEQHSLCRLGSETVVGRAMGSGEIYGVSQYSEVTAHLSQAPGIDLLVIDAGVPGFQGIESIRQLKADHPALAIVLLAISPDRDMMLDALCAGVQGLIPKTLPIETIQDAFSAVLSGKVYIPNIEAPAKAAEPSLAMVRVPGSNVCLTERQYEVLDLLAAGRSNKEIARELSIAEGTVKVHVATAFRLLGVHNRVSAAAALSTWAGRLNPEPYLPGFAGPDRRIASFNRHMAGAGIG